MSNETMMRCPKWESCLNDYCMFRHDRPHKRRGSCEIINSSCPACVPVESNQTKCPTCGGSGYRDKVRYLDANYPCSTCNGTGAK